MRIFNVMHAVVAAVGLYGAAALAAEPGINLNTKIASQKLKVHAATNPAEVAVNARGPINANIKLQGHPNGCVAVILEIAPGVCVPSGPGGPVSPN